MRYVQAKAADIMHENGNYWVCRDKRQKMYIVFKTSVTHSVSDSAYPLTEDGLSIAIARCNYMANKGK